MDIINMSSKQITSNITLDSYNTSGYLKIVNYFNRKMVIKKIDPIRCDEVISKVLFLNRYKNLMPSNFVIPEFLVLLDNKDLYMAIDYINGNNLGDVLKDKNINMLFYQDLRKLKDLSYDLIKKDLVDLDKCQDKIDKENTNKYKQRIYDLRDSKYTMLVRVQTKYNESSFNRRNCYSIISNENTNTYGYSEISGMFMYGYNSFENDRVIHMLEQDAFSSDSYSNNEVSKYVNRIATSRELTNGSSWYSEVEIVNLQNEDGKYTTKKPDFIVCYEEVRSVDIEEAEKLNIPIVIIRKTKLEKENQVDLAFDREKDIYSNNSYDERVHKNTR